MQMRHLPSPIFTVPNPPLPQVRPMSPADLVQVLQLQARCYEPRFHESAAAFHAKQARHPDHAWVADRDGLITAYLFAQPARKGYPPPLDDPGSPVQDADVLHLHDMAVAPEARGLGLPTYLLEEALAQGKRLGLQQATLVAVQGSEGFWRRLGFSPSTPLKSLESYGPDASYLLRPITLSSTDTLPCQI